MGYFGGAESDVRSSKGRIKSITDSLAKARKDNDESSIAFYEKALADEQAELSNANARLIVENQIESQRKAEESEERRHKELIKEQRRAAIEASIIEAAAAREEERRREESRIEDEKKQYIRSLTDEELKKLIADADAPELKDMINEANEELSKKEEAIDSLESVSSKIIELINEKKEMEKLINPSSMNMILAPYVIIGAIIAFIFKGFLRNLILEKFPSLWESSYVEGNYINYQVSNTTMRVTGFLVWVFIFVIFIAICYRPARNSFKNGIKKGHEAEIKIIELDKQIKKCEEEKEYFKNKVEKLKNNLKYDYDEVMAISDEIMWKSKYANEELKQRHYTEMDVKDLILKAKKR